MSFTYFYKMIPKDNNDTNDINDINDINDTNDINDINDTEVDVKNNKGWFKKHFKFLCLFIVFCVLLVISLLGFFIYPRPVSFELGDFQVKNTTLKSDGFESILEMNNSISNENYFDIDVQDYNIIITHPFYSRAFVNSKNNNMYILKKMNSQISNTFQIKYNQKFDINNMYITNLLSNCSNLDGMLYFDAKIDGVGKYILFTKEFSFSKEIYTTCKKVFPPDIFFQLITMFNV